MARRLHVRNAPVWRATPDGGAFARGDLYAGERVQAGTAPDSLRLDFDGLTIFPGLINAHDHLELNHYPRTKFRERYDNAHQWGEDVNARLEEPPFQELRGYRLDDRLFIGGLKNLLCGATTVAHHNPPHSALFRREFPVRVVRRYGWAHSLHFNSDDEIRAAHEATPPGAPFMIHLAEGTDDVARSEFARLKALGCTGANTVLVHGVCLSVEDVQAVGGLVWCPSSNRFLLGETLKPDLMTSRVPVALGSDSRLTADGDLLDEMRAAWDACLLPDHASSVLGMVTTAPASLLRLPDAGHLCPGARGDFVAIRSGDDDAAALCRARRADLALVVKGGVPQIGNPDVMAWFADVPTVAAVLDGQPKAIHQGLARRLLKCALREPGLEVDVEALRTRRRLFSRL